MVIIGEYVLDTLQIYFPWDDDLYGYLKEHGFGKGEVKALPLIYTDNCETTEGKTKTRRRYIITPDKFGTTYKKLGWDETDKKNEPEIPAEKIKLQIKLEDNNKIIIFKILPKDGDYHMEYSIMSAFGKIYSNWVNFYLPATDESFFNIYSKLKEHLNYKENEKINIDFNMEEKQNQREDFNYIPLPINYYEFSLEEFNHIKNYLTQNGFKGEYPKLYYDSKEKKCTKIMDPQLKYGIIQTKAADGFKTDRKPQIAFKIAQNKIIDLPRGKRGKVKGLISTKKGQNYFTINSDIFIKASNKLVNILKNS